MESSAVTLNGSRYGRRDRILALGVLARSHLVTLASQRRWPCGHIYIYTYICVCACLHCVYNYIHSHVYIHKRCVVGSAGTFVDLGIVVLKSVLKHYRLASASGAFRGVMQAYHA